MRLTSLSAQRKSHYANLAFHENFTVDQAFDSAGRALAAQTRRHYDDWHSLHSNEYARNSNLLPASSAGIRRCARPRRDAQLSVFDK
jgi:hypothetical protein